MTTPDAAPEPSEMDRALLRAVSDEVAEQPDGVAHLTHAWSDGGGMWFVEVQPSEPRAAFLSVAFDGEDLLNFTVGNIWFEVFPIDTPEALTDCARKVARAVVQGHLEESGFTGDAYGRIFVEDGPAMSVGRVHLPWPWRLRPFKRRYRPTHRNLAKTPSRQTQRALIGTIARTTCGMTVRFGQSTDRTWKYPTTVGPSLTTSTSPTFTSCGYW